MEEIGCGSRTHFSRRTLLKWSAVGGLAWTPVAEALARAAESSGEKRQPRSVIVLWLQGGPSQLDSFDPHPESPGAIKSIRTAVKGIELAQTMPLLAEQMASVSLVRSVVSKEGDHERATYNAKTGFRPDPTLVHPAIGAVLCHQMPDNVEIPRHVSILPGQWPARGGYLGDAFDAFKIGDPAEPIPDIKATVSAPRLAERVRDLEAVEELFARGRLKNLEDTKTLHRTTTTAALNMMSSEQLAAFDLKSEPEAVRRAFGDSAFGRGCLAAIRLIGVGVRCVEVTLDGWDTHANNRELQGQRVATLDPAFAALVSELKRRELLDDTVVVCGGEFGRTPYLNRLEGRDHWPHGFTVAFAGGGIRGGQVVGETAKITPPDSTDPVKQVVNARPIADIHATIFQALGIEFQKELDTPVGRPMKICEGAPIEELL